MKFTIALICLLIIASVFTVYSIPATSQLQVQPTVISGSFIQDSLITVSVGNDGEQVGCDASVRSDRLPATRRAL